MKNKIQDVVILDHYKQTKSATRTSKHFGVSRKRVTKIAKEAGVYESRKVDLSTKEESDILERFENGESQLSIAKDTGLSQTWIGRFLRRKGIEPQRPRRDKHSCWKGGCCTDTICMIGCQNQSSNQWL